jgi:hypothetical protein
VVGGGEEVEDGATGGVGEGAEDGVGGRTHKRMLMIRRRRGKGKGGGEGAKERRSGGAKERRSEGAKERRSEEWGAGGSAGAGDTGREKQEARSRKQEAGR